MTDFATLRATMVASQLRTVGVNDPDVVAAMTSVPREKFVPPGREAFAYADAAVPLGNGRALMEPMVTGLLLTHARIERHERVLLVGAATGYTAALIGRLADSVTAIESDTGLVALARAAGIINVIEAPLVEGSPDGAPYDLIYFDGAIEQLPATLVAQLKPGGRVAAVVIDGGVGRAKVGGVVGDTVVGAGVIEVSAPLLPGFAKAVEFVF